jgi:hypothetical protein
MAANSNDPKSWSLWRWPVVGWGAALAYSSGLGALSFDQFDLAAILFVGATAW